MIKKILLPTDFSFHAFSAYQYANRLAFEYGAELILLHVISGSFNTGEVLDFAPLKQVEDSMLTRLKYFSTEYPTEEDIKIKQVPTYHEIRFGVPGFTITDFARDHEIDLIVIGARDKHGIFDRIIGSASSIVISTSETPMIFIHEKTRFQEIKKMVFGFDGLQGLEDSLGFIKSFNQKWKAAVDFVHVMDDDDKELDKAVNEIVEEMVEEEEINYPFSIKKLKGSNPNNTLMDYCIDQKSDLLVVYHRKSSFMERLFKRSHSVHLAQSLTLPVLVLPAAR